MCFVPCFLSIFVLLQILAVRAIIRGDLERFIEEAMLHGELIHEKFTSKMRPWQLEWESSIWYDSVDSCTERCTKS